MFSKGDSIAGPVLFTAAVIAGILGFWFWDASNFHPGINIDTSYRSYMPDKCSVIADRAGDTRKSAQVYLWGANARIDLRISDVNSNKITNVHILVTPGSTYKWLEGGTNGDVLRGTKDYSMIQNIAGGDKWFCVPWIFFNPSVLNVPGDVTFNEPSGY